jgi:hypothetical protein
LLSLPARLRIVGVLFDVSGLASRLVGEVKLFGFAFESLEPVRLAYQPPANSIFLSQQTSHQQPASSTFLSE